MYEIEIRDGLNGSREWYPVVSIRFALVQQGMVPVIAYIDKDSRLALALGSQTIRKAQSN
jgi:hypothetical protein